MMPWEREALLSLRRRLHSVVVSRASRLGSLVIGRLVECGWKYDSEDDVLEQWT